MINISSQMDIKAILVQGHTQSNTLKVVDYVGVNKSNFKKLITIYLEGPYRITQRAAWPLSVCVERHPSLIYPHLTQILNFLKKDNIHVAVKRNTVRLLQYIEIPKRLHSKVTNICLNFLLDRKEAIAVRVFSMTVLNNLSRIYPDLKNELKLIIEDELPYASAGFLSRAKHVLKEMNK